MGYAASTMLTYSLSLFLEPLEQAFGWTRVEIMAGSSIVAVICVLLSPVTGAAVDRFGPRWIGIGGLVALGSMIAAFAFINGNYLLWLIVWTGYALATVCVLPTVWTAGVVRRFRAGRGLAIGATMCGPGISTFISPLAAHLLIDGLGWRYAFIAMPLLWGIVVLPILFFFHKNMKRHDVPEPADQAARAGRKGLAVNRDVVSGRFIRLLAAGLCFAAVVPPMVISAVPILSSAGLPRGEVVTIASLAGVAAICGRIIIGYLLDHLDARVLGMMLALLPSIACGILLAFPASVPMAALAIIALGFTLGAEYDVLAYMTSRFFATEHFGLLFGTLAGVIGLATSLGPVWFNAIFDHGGSYVPALWIALPLCPVAALLFASLGRYPTALEGHLQRS
ncbi:MFS transporter [Sphingobium tyrosinilyticum]|uniref:MFS transporter n=1 Tax=Sphingobium tyrosinilyticum TaxID=2715436 RepID=A0ABV9F2P0_9SPHN